MRRKGALKAQFGVLHEVSRLLLTLCLTIGYGLVALLWHGICSHKICSDSLTHLKEGLLPIVYGSFLTNG